MEYENSGTERKEGSIFCPKCGTRLQAGDVFCDNCGYELGGQRKKKLAGMKELRLPLAIGGAAVVIMAAGVFFAVKGLGFLGGGFGGAAEELLFISDESVYGVDLKKPDKKPVEYTDSFYDTEEDTIGNVFRLSFPTGRISCQDRTFPYKKHLSHAFRGRIEFLQPPGHPIGAQHIVHKAQASLSDKVKDLKCLFYIFVLPAQLQKLTAL